MKQGLEVRTDPNLRPKRYANVLGVVRSNVHGEVGVELAGHLVWFRPNELKSTGRKVEIPTPAESDEAPSEASLVRAWARQNGYEVGTRGRLSPELLTAYRAAHGVSA